MNWLDVIILIVWGGTVLWGLWNGLLRTLFPLAVVMLALVLGSRFSEPVGNVFSPLTSNENVQTIAAFAAIFIVLFGLAMLVRLVFSTLLNALVIFGLIDRLAGMVLGLLVGFVLLSGVLTAIQRFPVAGIEDAIEESALGPFLADNFDVVIRSFKLIPRDWDDRIGEPR